MGRCGVFAQTAGYEGGSPKTVLEALASGAPVVAVNTYGQGNVIDATRTGVLTSDDAASVAHGLARVLTDEELRGRIGAAASAWARREHGLGRIAELEIAAHRAALARSEGGATGTDVERRAA
jgi:glycosyltransferase involved in cell wall biosynthesis